MERTGFIVSVDLGTSKIIGVLGRKNEQGIISVLASECIPADSCVKYGLIYNIDEAAGKIKKLINLLENKTGKKIGKVFVSVAGKSLRAIEHKETKLMDGVTPITFADVDKMEQQAKLNKPDFFTNYSVLAPEYYIDGKLEEDPIGKTGSTLDGSYRLVIGRPSIKTSLSKIFIEKNNVDIAGFIVGSVANAAFVLDEADRQVGCALVDFGAGTTTLSIYKGGVIRYMVVIPFGGKTITKDVQALGFVRESAENYKIRYGKVGKDKVKSLTGAKPEIDLRELNKVIQLRQEEIVLNVVNQIKLSGFEDQLEAGIILIGGASQLDGLEELMAEKAQMAVKKGTPKRFYINNAADLVQNPIYTEAIGLLLFANENCERKEPIVVEQSIEVVQKPLVEKKLEPTVEGQEEEDDDYEEEEPKKKKKKKEDKKQRSLFDLFEKIQNFGGTMFKDEE